MHLDKPWEERFICSVCACDSQKCQACTGIVHWIRSAQGCCDNPTAGSNSVPICVRMLITTWHRMNSHKKTSSLQYVVPRMMRPT